MKDRIRIATRRSQLALVQTRWVAERLERLQPGLQVELCEMITVGDRVQDRVPVVTGLGAVPNLPKLKHFGAAASSSGTVPSAGIAWTFAAGMGSPSSSASRPCRSLRSGESAGTNRSSPHHTWTPDQSTASRTGDAATARSVAMPRLPPVTTTCSGDRTDCRSISRTRSRAAVASATVVASGCTTVST